MKRVIGISVFLALSVAWTGFSAGAVDRGVYNVRDYGAKGDGKAKDTAALQRALNACAKAGGGTVRLPEGVYLSGSLVMGANTTLRLEQHADLVGSPEAKNYPLVRVRFEGEFRPGHRALICAENAPNIRIEGPGAIFGPPPMVSRLRDPRGPVLLELTGCTNAVLENFTTQYERLWSIHVLYCQNLEVRNLIIETVGANGDGIDVDSCTDVTIERCDINTGDDAISLKSGRGLAAAQLNRPTQNITIRNCTLASSIFAAVGIGTELSGGIRNVKLEDCTLSGRQNAIFLKSRDGRGGSIENLTGENLTVNDSPTFLAIDLLQKGIQASDPVPGDVDKWTKMSGISFRHIRVNSVAELVVGRNVPAERPVDGLALSDITGTCGRGLDLANMTNVDLSDIKVTGYKGPLITTQNVNGKGLDGAAAR